MDTTIVPDITLRFTPFEHVAAYARLHREAQWQLQQARTVEERMDAELWIINAERQLLRWQAVVDRQVAP